MVCNYIVIISAENNYATWIKLYIVFIIQMENVYFAKEF